jgi:N-acetylglucosaminyl-diphospho-decaprenol L-rhamnosyltransferase
MAFDDVAVICVTFNSADCLPSLAQTLKPFQRVIVVDNASADATFAAVAAAIPQAKVIANPRNLGFGAANNLALQELDTSGPCC